MKGGEKRMKMTKIYCVILCLSLILSVFSGCQSSEKKDKTSSEKQTAASVSSETSTNNTSTAESDINFEDNSSLNSKIVSNKSSIVSNTSSNSKKPRYSIPIYPDAPYANAPYKHPMGYGCDSVEEIRELISKADSESFWDGYFISLIKLFKENGHFVEPFYEGNSLFDEEKFAKTSVGLRYETKWLGAGYNIDFETKKGEEYSITIYCLKNEWLEEARNKPYRYSSGKIVKYYEDIDKNYDRKEGKIKAQGKEFIVNYYESELTRLCFVYDEYLVKVDSTNDIQYFIENFSLTKIPLEE